MRTADLFDLSERVAIVTGGGTGLGRQMAEGLAELGANLVLCARKVERCEETAAALRAGGARAVAMRCDVRVPTEITAVVERAMEEFGRVDILVNNAGAAWGAPALELPLDAWQKVIDVNLTGVFLFCQAAGRVMRERGSGSIVNVASVAGLSGTPAEILDSVPYNATKAAVINLTRDLAVKWAEYGIRVNALAPGWFPTNLTRHFPDDLRDRVIAGVPQRRFGGPDDLKGAAAFLASDASAFVTGHTLVVDGGESICG